MPKSATSAPKKPHKVAASTASTPAAPAKPAAAHKAPAAAAAASAAPAASAPKAAGHQDFPRGGASELTPLEYREISDKVKEDVLFSEAAAAETAAATAAAAAADDSSANKKKSKKRAAAAAAEEAAEASKKSKLDKPAMITLLNHKRLNVGMSLIGVIKEINQLDMVVSLPNQLTGFVSITEISDHISQLVELAVADDDEDDAENAKTTDVDDALPSLDKYFSIGQPVLCRILSLETTTTPEKGPETKKKRIDLSLKPEQINAELNASDLAPGMIVPATVSSREDHGYIVSIGIGSVSGFLRNDQVGPYLAAQGISELAIGSVVACSVLNVDASGRTVALSIDPKRIASATMTARDDVQLSHIRPGCLVTAKVDEIMSNGISASIFKFFKAHADWFHLSDSPIADTDQIGTLFKEGQKIKARVLYVDLKKKVISLTLLPNLIAWSNTSFDGLEIGAMADDVSIIRVDPGVGVLAKFPGDRLSYVHISRMADTHLTKIDKSYRPGTTHRGRIIAFDYCDGIAVLSFEPKVLNQPFLRLADIKAGMIIKGEIQRLIPVGVVVSVTDSIRGLCPKLHFSDATINKPERMFRDGITMKFQVLSVDAASKRLILTHKQSLMTSKLEPLLSYSSAVVDQLTMGIITAVKSFGCIVTFYNEVRAIVPLSELGETFVQTPSDLFTVGQAVKCRILSVDPAKEKMRVSFKLTPTAKPAKNAAAAAAAIKAPAVGEILNGTVVSKTTVGVVVQVDGFDNITIAKAHLSDFPAHTDKLFESLDTGDKVSNILVLNVDARKRVTATLKQSLVAQVRRDNGVRQFKDLAEGDMIAGFVRHSTDKSCFVEFAGGLVGVASLHNVSDSFVSNIADHVQTGQSVIAFISKLESDTTRIFVSLKASSLSTSASLRTFELERLTALLAERSSFAISNIPKFVKTYTLGQVVEATVEKKIPYGYLAKIDGTMSGLISNSKRELKVNETVKCTVLDYDQETRIVDLAIVDANVSSSASSALREQLKAAQAALKSDQKVDATVELIKDQFAIVSLSKLKGAVAFCLARAVNSVAGPFVRFKVGDQIQVQLGAVPAWAAEQTSLMSQRILATPVKSDAVAPKSLEAKRAVTNAVDPAIKSIDDVKIGYVTKAVVRSVKETQINLRLGDNLNGRIHATEIYDSLDDIADLKHPLRQFKSGETITGKVFGFHDTKTHAFLPISHRNSTSQTSVELTLRPSDLARPQYELVEDPARRPTFETLVVGSERIGIVHQVDVSHLRVQISVNLIGAVSAFDASTDPSVCADLTAHFTVGQAVRAFVMGKNTEKKQIDLSLVTATPLTASALSVGQIVAGRVSKIDAAKGMVINLSKRLTARVHLTDLEDVFTADPTSKYVEGQFVRAVIVSLDPANSHIDCSLAPSALKQAAASAGADSNENDDGDADMVDAMAEDDAAGKAASASLHPTRLEDITPGQIVAGYVHAITEKGCFVSLRRNISARVKIAELSDAFIKDWKAAFKSGQLVKGKVLSVDLAKKQLELTLKLSAVDPEGALAKAAGHDADKGLRFADLKVGLKIKGTVKRIETYGLFIQLQNSHLTGLCHSSEVADKPVKDLERLYSVGDSVKAIILRLNTEKKRISLGLKSKYFEDADAEDADDSDEDEDNDEDVVMAAGSDDDGEEDGEDDDEDGDEIEFGAPEGLMDNDSDDGEEEDDDEEGDFVEMDEDEDDDAEDDDAEDDDDEDDDDEDDDDDDMPAAASNALATPLAIQGFSWDAEGAIKDSDAEDNDDDDNQESDDSDSDQDDANAGKRSRRAKKRAKAEEEKRVAQEEMALVDGETAPESADDFERLLLGSPNNSFLWIKYMVFHLQMAEVEKARQVGDRALKTINFREEQERLNVWIAYLNLENTYGTPESLAKVFERAAQMNDAKTIHLRLAQIYERTDKEDACIKLFTVMCKKFKESAQVWTGYAQFLMRRGKLDAARQLLSRCLKSLPKRKHIDTTSSFAQMEFKMGEPERGRTIFEGLMATCPKRADLWSVYIDMEIRTGDVAVTRRLFERVLEHKWSTKKMKFFFKRFLDYEKKHGDSKGVEHVKAAAMRYVESL